MKTGIISFKYRISPSPDFIAELRKWGDEVKMEDIERKKISLSEERQ